MNTTFALSTKNTLPMIPMSRPSGAELRHDFWGGDWTPNAKRWSIVANPAGWLWSEHLESWLVPDQAYLRLYDRHHQLRLTGEEAEAQRAEIAIRQADALADKLRSLGVNPDEL